MGLTFQPMSFVDLINLIGIQRDGLDSSGDNLSNLHDPCEDDTWVGPMTMTCNWRIRDNRNER